MSSYTDVFVREDDSATYFAFRSGLAVYNEVFRGGALHSLGWNLAGYVSPLDQLPRLDGRVQTESFRLEAGGEDMISGWQLVGHGQDATDRGIAHRIELEHARRPVRLVIHTELDGTAVLSRRLEITNTSDGHLPVAQASVWSGLLFTDHVFAGIPSEPPAVDIGYMHDARWGFEGAFDWTRMPESELVVTGRSRRPSHRHPMFVARIAENGAHFIGQLAWSGGYEFGFDYERYPSGEARGRGPWLSFRAAMDAPSPQIVLEPGESVPTATMHLGGVNGGLDEAIDAMTTHVRTSVLIREPSRLGHVCAGIGPEQEINTESVLFELESAARAGADTFWIDANWYSAPGGNWFRNVGDWNVDPGRFPEGLEPIKKAAAEKGIRFGLWMEPERIGSESQTFQERPELRSTDYTNTPSEVIDLGDDAVADWMLQQIRKVIAGQDIGFYRIDFNIGFMGNGYQRDRGGFAENHYWRYYLNHYRIFAQLREEFPDVIFQTCAGGGGRTDLGMLGGFDDTWVTDWQLAPRTFSIINGMTMALPPEYIDRLAGMGMESHDIADHDFQLRLLLFGRPTVGWPNPIPSDRNPVQEARTKHMVDVYREHIDPICTQTRIYHHTPTGFEGRWGVLERAAYDASVSVIGLFRMGTKGSDEYRVKPRGIDPSKRYLVTFDNENVSTEIDGSTLLIEGVAVHRDAALTSQLLILKAI